MRKPIGTWIMRGGVCAVFATSLAFAGGVPTTAYADASQASSFEGTLTSAVSARVDESTPYVAYVTFNDNVTAKITFLEAGIFRYNVDLSGEFSNYATPRSKDHVAKIQAQPDSSGKYAHPKASTGETDTAVTVTDGTVTLSFEKATGKLTVLNAKNEVVFTEASPLTITGSATTQSLVKDGGENYFGGGTQNGRFVHTGNSIDIVNNNNYNDGGVSSPNPFYWSSDGYGVLRNTFAQGSYDFGKTDGSVASATHNDGEFDAYYFVSDDSGNVGAVAQDVLQDYFKVTGNPVLLPESAFYVGHLNAYNRDMWMSEEEYAGADEATRKGYSAWRIKGHSSADGTENDVVRYERGGTGTELAANTHAESLNGKPATVSTENIPEGVDTPEEFSARARLDEYQDYDMPLGYFLANDGYGAGYGQNGYKVTGGVDENGQSSPERRAALAANVENLKEFTEYANAKGVDTGLWTQSQLTPDSNNATLWQTLRDFDAEVKKGGVTTLKTDVAWVGSGYSFGLNGTKTAYDIVTTSKGDSGDRPNIITLDGWAGTQRFGGIWTGDQTGGNWEYIRFHIPTFIGQSLSGNPNIGSDMDGIWGGNPIIATRDYQWKSFAPLMLDMDGWGSYAKMPYTYGDPYTGINRMYLKLKSSLMPYIYTTAASAANIDTGNGDAGLPFVRAIALSDDSAYAVSTATQYEYTMGDDILVAPIYQNTDGDSANNGIGDGDDIRNNIYLPGDSETIWIDYWTGEQYRGGQVLNNFEAPIWKLPIFVKANAIIPMYKPNDNPSDIDRTQRDIEFFAVNGSNDYTLYEDTGSYIENKTDSSDEEYGVEDNISYGSNVKTHFTSKVDGDKAVFTAEASEGTYDGYDSNRTTTFVVNVSKNPESLVARNGEQELTQKTVASKAEFDAATPAEGEAVVFYDEAPNLNYNATAEGEAVRNEEFSKTAITTTPKLYVKFAKTDVNVNAQTLEVKGFENDGNLPLDEPDESLAAPAGFAAPEEQKTPTSITLTWDKVEGATGYELMVDGTVFAVGGDADTCSYTHNDLAYNSTHRYQVRALSANGHSAWTEVLETASLQDPWRNTPVPQSIDWTGTLYGNHSADLAFDHFYQSGDGGFHSGGGDMGQTLTVDYGVAYNFTTLDYHPRDDAGNGTVTKMRIETSLDGNHWQSREVDWELNAETKTVELNTAARYVRMTPLAARGDFFSASEICINKADGTSGFEVGSINGDSVVSDADYQHLTGNCIGREDRGYTKDQFETHVANHGADFNFNGVYDVYDMSFTMAKLDGGTAKTDKVSGSVFVVPSQTEVKAGDVITVDLYVDGAAGINAMGSVVHFKDSQFEYVPDSIQANPFTAGMDNQSIAQTGFDDGTQTVNLALANRGDKDLYAGTGSVISFQLRAVADGPVQLESTSWLVGPTFDYIEVADDGTGITLPEKPTPTASEYGQDAFDVTVTNDALPTDDGTNAATLLQGGSFNPLFDDVKYHDGSSGSGTLELKWNTAEGDPTVHTPLDLHFTFKNPSVLDDATITNRVDANGSIVDRGAVNRIAGTVTFEDGTTQEFSGGDFDTKQPTYRFVIDDANKGKPVTRVDVNILETSATNLMTISEIDFNYTTAVDEVEGVELGENATSIYEGDLTPVMATVLPDTLDYPYFTVTSSDPAIASVTQVQVGDRVLTYVRGNKPGTVTITVASALDSTKTASYELEVKEGIDIAPLQSALDDAHAYSASAYTEESYGALAEAVSAAEELLKSGSYTKQDIAEHVVAIENAIKGLQMRPVDEETLINTSADSGVTALGASTSVEGKPGDVLDYDESTYWHSTYAAGAQLPQWIMFDLGDEYDLTDVTFLPRQDGALRGDVFEFEVVTAASQEDLRAYVDNGYATPAGGSAVNLGTFSFDNDGHVINDRSEWKQASFGAQATRYVMLVVTKSGGNDQGNDLYCNMAEVRFYGAEHEDPVVADKAALQELVDKIVAEDLKAEDYTDATWTPFELALSDAQRLLADAEATQAEVDQALDKLTAARDGLVETEVPPVENPTRDELEGLIGQAQDIDTAGKTTESVQALADAIAYAQKVIGDENATDAQLKDAYDQLKLAIEGLEDEQGGEPGGGSGTGTEKPGDTGGSGNGGQTGGSGSGSGGTLAQTGDASLLGTIAAGISGLVAGGAGLFLHRRRRR